MEADGEFVAHGAGGDEEGGFFAEEFGGGKLELGDGGVIAEDVVADRGFGHGFAHGGGGLGDGVAAEVDHGLGIIGRGEFLHNGRGEGARTKRVHGFLEEMVAEHC